MSAHREATASVIGVRPLEAFIVVCAVLCVAAVFAFLIMWTANSATCPTPAGRVPSPTSLPTVPAR